MSYEPSWGHDQQGFWVETVEGYDPSKGRRPVWRVGDPKDVYEQKLAIRKRWEILAGLIDEHGQNVHSYGPGQPEPEPKPVRIAFPGTEPSDQEAIATAVRTLEDALIHLNALLK